MAVFIGDGSHQALVLLLLFLSQLEGPAALFFGDTNNYGATGHDSHNRNRRSVGGILPSNYSAYEAPPSLNGTPMAVKLSVVVMNVRDIKEIGEEISIEMNLRIYWKDSRLSSIVAHLVNSPSPSSELEHVLLPPAMINEIWHPDIFIDHVKKIDQPSIISKPSSLRIYPDNTLRYSARITISIACPMDFHYYPADTQKCDCDFKSYAYSEDKMTLAWTGDEGATFAKQELDLSNFFVGLENSEAFSVKAHSGSYAGLRFSVVLARKLSYHMIQTYLPSIVLVVVSWLSFLVSPDAVPGRMTVLMTCLLTLISMFAAVRNSTPNVSYVKSVDTWMSVCVFFVFLALMEFTLVLKVKRMKFKSKDTRKQSEASTTHSVRSSGRGNYMNHSDYPNPVQFRRVSNPRMMAGPLEEHYTEMTDFVIQPRRKSREFGDSIPSRPLSYPSAEHARPPGPFLMKQQPRAPAPLPPSPNENPNEKIVANVERTASVVIPISFLIFNLFYWPWLIVSSEYYKQDFSK